MKIQTLISSWQQKPLEEISGPQSSSSKHSHTCIWLFLTILQTLNVSSLDCRLILKEGQAGTQAENAPWVQKGIKVVQSVLSDHISPTPNIPIQKCCIGMLEVILYRYAWGKKNLDRTGDSVVDFFSFTFFPPFYPLGYLWREVPKKWKCRNFAGVRFHFICYILNKSPYFYYEKLTLP